MHLCQVVDPFSPLWVFTQGNCAYLHMVRLKQIRPEARLRLKLDPAATFGDAFRVSICERCNLPGPLREEGIHQHASKNDGTHHDAQYDHYCRQEG